MKTKEQTAVELIKQLQKNSQDYLEGNQESKYSIAALTNQLVQLWRKEEGFTPFNGRKAGGNENDRNS